MDSSGKMSDNDRIGRAEFETLLFKYKKIREMVSAIDVGTILGMDIDKKGRCRCPFHNGTNRNLQLYDGKNGNGYYCFVCHAYGDCISLAKKLLTENCTYTDAAKWIDRTFQLKVFENRKPSFQERVRRAQIYAATHGGNAR